ncbi:uncharacterized protein LOC116339330 [Contarinia nasturtii]|uniref:uncharacterized protein LOC116339330 n=1 Tax=Contarinia nasturtii TaxID=265458 RepID=UPI0012D3BA94|nr:uncharacterized protein LOC116339330 [Contarinia nasturtii]
MYNSINCIVVIAFVNMQLLCLPPVDSAIDALVQDYLNAEKNLWHLVRSTTNLYKNDDTLAHIYETHEFFMAMNFNEIGRFDTLSKQERNISHENRIMERHLWRIVDAVQHINITALNTQRILSHNQYEYLPNIMKDIAQNMPKMLATLCKYTDTKFWLFIKNNSQVCYKDVVHVALENQALVEFYNEIVAAALKCYMLLQMTYMVQTATDLGNFNDPGYKLRESFSFNVTAIQNYVRIELTNASHAMWAYSFIEISRFYQGYIENEINLNPEGNCRQTCDEYTETKHYHCAENSLCANLHDPSQQSKLICQGTIRNCQYIDGSFNICPTEEGSMQRYKFLVNDDGSVFGGEKNCNHLHTIRAKSWWSWYIVAIVFVTVKRHLENIPTDTSVFGPSFQIPPRTKL